MGTETQQGKKPAATAPEMPKPVRNRGWAWLAGIFLALVMGAGMFFPAIPVLGALAAIFVGLGGLGIAIGLMAAFLLPRTLFAAKGVGETVAVAKSFGKTFFKAVLWGGITFAFGFFLMPLLMPMLAGVTGLGFLSAFGGTGLISTILTALSATFTFLKTMYKGDFMPTLLANKARAAEMFLGVGVIVVGALALAGGVLPFALPLAVPIVALFVGFALALGVITNISDYLTSRTAPAAQGTERANLSSATAPLTLPAERAATLQQGAQAAATVGAVQQPAPSAAVAGNAPGWIPPVAGQSAPVNSQGSHVPTLGGS